MKFSIDKQEKYCVLALNEEKLTSLTAPELKSELVTLSNEGHTSMILDLKDVQYIDSSGLSGILTGNRIAKDTNGSFVVCNLTDHVLKLITISKLDSVLNIVPTQEEAIDAVFLDQLENDVKNSSKS
ncbi:MAG: STAS domain-containing protein [Cyclobacteriaceae bacterium]